MAKKVKKTKKSKESECCSSSKSCSSGCGGAVYGLGFVGSAIYFISHATGFWMGVFGLLKALVWPAFLVYELLKFLGM